MDSRIDQRRIDDDPPPFFAKWSRVYVLVLLYLLILINLLYFVSKALMP
jgi:hypothetical protein